MSANARSLWRAAWQQLVEADAPCGDKRGEDVAMRQRPADLEAGLADRGQRIAAQGSAQGLNALDRQFGEVGQGAVLDLAVLAVGFPQQVGGTGEPPRVCRRLFGLSHAAMARSLAWT
jgi:hypothetical protein